MRIEGHVIAREVIFDPQSSASMAVGMRMMLVMLPEHVLAVSSPAGKIDDQERLCRPMCGSGYALPRRTRFHYLGYAPPLRDQVTKRSGATSIFSTAPNRGA